MAQLGLGHVGIQPSPPFIHWDHSFSCSTTFSFSCCNNLFFCRSSKSTIVFLMDKACAHECLLGRSVADILCIAVHIQYVLRLPLRPDARPCIFEKSPFTIALALGESWLLLAHPQKNTYKGCSPEKAVSARLTNCNVATGWHVELSTLGPIVPSSSFI